MKQSLSPLNSNRAKLYSILSLFFIYPTPELQKEVKQSLSKRSRLMLSLKKQGCDLTKAWASLSEASFDGIEEEHTRLFISGAPVTTALPYGSVYLEKTLQGESTDWLRQKMQAQGLIMRDKTELPDHITIVLEYISYLIGRNESTEEIGAYLQKWTGEFLKALEGNSAPGTFYHRLAIFSRSFLEFERR